MPAGSFAVADLVDAVAAEVPDRLALVAGERRLTYRELDERTTRFARALIDRGVQPGDKVGIYAWNRAEWTEAFLGAFKARAVPINVNYRYVAAELVHVLGDADVVALVFERTYAPVVADVRPQLPLLEHLLVLEDGTHAEAPGATPYEDALAVAGNEPLDIERSGDDLYLLYTGGTTGLPKGVMWRQEDLFYAALSSGQVPVSDPAKITDRITPAADRPVFLMTAPVMHGAANWAMLIALYSGGSAVLYTGHGFDPHEVLRIAERERATSISVVGDAMARPLADALDDGTATYDLTSLKSFGSGGAVFSPAVREVISRYVPNAMIIDTFGSSEMGASGLNPGKADRVFYVNEEQTVLGDDLLPVAPGSGVVGRVARRGHIPLGYYKDEAKTAATFVTGPDGVRWVIPGDFATLEADGQIAVLGRGSSCINTGGEKVFPDEVEGALKAHPAVFDALVVGVPDTRFGERVAAVVQLRDGVGAEPAALQDHCRTLVAGYKVPREFVFTDLVPRTASGKPEYARARALAEAATKD